MDSDSKFKYLKPEQYYIDLYDLGTIRECLYYYQSFIKKLPEARALKTNEPEEKNENDWLRVTNIVIYSIKTERFKYKNEAISKWIDRDRNRQEKFDNSSPLELYCNNCSVLLSGDFKSLHENNNGEFRVSHLYTCPKCKGRSAYYDNGDKFVVDPELCQKCGSIIEVSLKINEKNDVTTWTHKCKGCSDKSVYIDDFKKTNAERLQNEKRNKELLDKYRNDFCFTDKEGNNAVIRAQQISELVKSWKEQEKKDKDPVYKKAKAIKRISVTVLNKLLKEALESSGYINLIFEKPDMSRYVIVPFIVENSKVDKTQYDIINDLKKLTTKTLLNTNWRLMSDGINYRAGYLTGRLRCYENDDDLFNLLKDN